MVSIAVTLASLAAAFGIAQAATLLNGGGFNGAFGPQAGINGTVPAGWTAVNLNGNPIWTDSNSFAGGEKTEGTNAAVIVSENIEKYPWPYSDGWAFDGVLYQQVHNVVSGTAYSFGSAMLTFCGGTAMPSNCPANYYMGKSIGIDPTGGTSPTAATVVWSQENTFNHQWRDITTATRALSTTITVFIRVRWPFTFHGAFAVYDAAFLAQAPTAYLHADPPVSSGPITVSWGGNVPQDVSDSYGGIQLGYDVQVFDPGGATWQNLMTSTQLTSTVFNGTVGNTYRFRVLPFLGYLPDNHRFDGLYTEPVSVTVADLSPPSSSMAALAPVQHGSNFQVAWYGTDDHTPAPSLVYDIQYRDGPNGTWATWLTATSQITALYSGQPLHHYYFRSRAHDQSGNVEAYRATADAATTTALAVAGTIRNLREEPVALASAQLNPADQPGGLAGADGQYTLWITASNSYSLAVARNAFGALPPLRNVVVGTTNLVGVDAILPPLDDLIANGQFESGALDGWTSSGPATPSVTTTAHSGDFAAALGGNAGVETSLQQTFFVTPTLVTPTLSFLYQAPLGANDLFTVTLRGDSSSAVLNPAVPANAWSHQWLDLSSFAGQTVTATFAFRPTDDAGRLLIDEVSAGNAVTVAYSNLYIPIIGR